MNIEHAWSAAGIPDHHSGGASRRRSRSAVPTRSAVMIILSLVLMLLITLAVSVSGVEPADLSGLVLAAGVGGGAAVMYAVFAAFVSVLTRSDDQSGSRECTRSRGPDLVMLRRKPPGADR